MNPSLLQSSLLSHIPHAFSTRLGGVSRAPFDSLNFGNPSDLAPELRDSKENIGANFEIVKRAIGCGDSRVVQVHQVHGAEVHVVRRGGALPDITWGDVKADAIVTDDPDALIAVRVADCTPVVLASADGAVVGVAHAGWRGVIAGVVARTMEKMRELGATGIVGAIGPCIGGPEFEIGAEVVEIFRREFGDDRSLAWDVDGGKGRADLKACIARQMERAGAREIDVLPHCTIRDAALFYSHRREKGMTGRMIGAASPRRRSVGSQSDPANRGK